MGDVGWMMHDEGGVSWEGWMMRGDTLARNFFIKGVESLWHQLKYQALRQPLLIRELGLHYSIVNKLQAL